MAEPDSRFFQANERTLLAWLRTGLGLSAFGFAVAKSGALIRVLAPGTAEHPLNAWLGVALVLAGVMAMSVGLLRYHRVHSALREGRSVPDSATAVTVLSILTIVVALLLAVYQLIS
ncbi:DUF202 domain-containing protein [Pseudenhygromyxa sp. WMMC2535]|uniref:YidH family protein n=1 Tax=Pseudenhygromyxa sp. WMMC2535 TaxID=2712867 RepID=UPI00155830A2|nr:DUF202 domain-containing protein [Pseudenhygromyxa sp. WMMC2535]NVB37417.1 DUF202 domain-containing protein [Pseudenhygromyxa sp. WMMC2535]